MSRSTHRRRRSAPLLAIALPLGAAGLAPSAGNASAYNVGVDWLHFGPAADTCLADQALPCTPGAGEGNANVLRVVQTEVDGHYQFTTLEGTSQVDGRIWVAAEIGADCRLAHHLTHVISIDGNLAAGDSDGIWSGDGPNSGGNGSVETGWPRRVTVPHANTMPDTTVAVHVPIADAFDPANPLVDFFPSVDDVLAAGEAEIQRRVDDGMTYAEARAIPYELNTAISLSAEVVCAYNGGFSAEYFMRRSTSIPLRIEYVPVEVPAPVGDLPPAVGDVAAPAEVTDASLIVLPDPADPCTLHLSATISTNRETDVQYRFVNPYGQPSNTYEVHVDDTNVAMISRSVDVPFIEGPEPGGDFAPTPGGGGIGGYAGEENGTYSGTYELEILSPNHVEAADGFSVPYCEDYEAEFEPADDVVAEPDPTHGRPTTTLPSSLIPETTAPPSVPPPPPTTSTSTPTYPTTTAPSTPPVLVIGVVATATTTP